MTPLREAAQQALEALKKLVVGSDYEEAVEAEQAMDALRAALAEPDYWQEEARRYAGNADYWRNRYEALAEPVQEPVAWRTFDGEGGYDYRTYEDNEDYAAEWAKRNPRHVGWVEPLYATPPQALKEDSNE